MDSLMSEFLTETTESLNDLDTDLVKLEQNPDDNALLSNIFRTMHTIKGTCGFLGLDKLEKIAHAGENILGKIRDGEIKADSEIISVILRTLDQIKNIVSALSETGEQPEVDNSALIKEIEDLIEIKISGKGHQEIQSNAPSNIQENKDPKSEIIEEKPIIGAVLAEPVKTEPVDTEQDETESVEAEMDKIESTKKSQETSIKIKNEEEKHTSSNNQQQTIRVNLHVLETLMQTISELVLTRNQLLQILRNKNGSEFSGPLQRLNHITSELQEGVMKTRMQPIGNAWAKFPRLIRDLSVELNKKIELEMIGEETELDRQLIETIKDPLTHMIRNSADHGLEPPEERVAKGKSEHGTITLKAYHQGGHIIIEVKDDGRGLNIERIKAKILEQKLATESELEVMSQQQITQYIFRAGFSTAKEVTAVSGRGVGMDVVKSNIERISGNVDLTFVAGEGCNFQIKIPLTLAIMPILIVEASEQKFGIPQINVIELVRTGEKTEHSVKIIDGKKVLSLRGALLPLISLSEVLKLEPKNQEEKTSITDVSDKNFIIICEIGSYNFGITVDKIYDTEEIVVKPVSPVLNSLDIYSGSTILGDGKVIMILDPNGLSKTTVSNDAHIESKNSISKLKNSSSTYNSATFLICRAGDKTPKAIPLELVSRLEEIDIAKIEVSIGKEVVQYRDILMHLVKIDPAYQYPSQGSQSLIVISDKNNMIGLVVDEILDIVEVKLNYLDKNNQQEGYVGSIIINETTHDVIDVQYYFNSVFGSNSYSSNLSEESSKKSDILFIDDSPFFRKLLPSILEEEGFAVKSIDKPTTALQILEENNDFKAIITDINMPEMDGVEFVKHCKSMDKLKGIPILILSSNISNKSQKELDEIGIKNLIAKTNHAQLIETLRKL